MSSSTGIKFSIYMYHVEHVDQRYAAQRENRSKSPSFEAEMQAQPNDLTYRIDRVSTVQIYLCNIVRCRVLRNWLSDRTWRSLDRRTYIQVEMANIIATRCRCTRNTGQITCTGGSDNCAFNK